CSPCPALRTSGRNPTRTYLLQDPEQEPDENEQTHQEADTDQQRPASPVVRLRTAWAQRHGDRSLVHAVSADTDGFRFQPPFEFAWLDRAAAFVTALVGKLDLPATELLGGAGGTQNCLSSFFLPFSRAALWRRRDTELKSTCLAHPRRRHRKSSDKTRVLNL